MMQAQAPAQVRRVAPATATITPRTFSVDLSAVPRHWMAGRPVPTHLVNGLNLLFPIGERFFVRSVNAYLEELSDPALIAEVKAFFSQEGKHASTHDRVNQHLRDQGFQIDGFLRVYRRGVEAIERALPPVLRLAATAATEQFTAVMAEAAFSSPLLEHADPAMKALLAWHALEEIEHRAVAFDVLTAVSPSYAVRVAGLAIATFMLGAFWAAATFTLLRQEPARQEARKWQRPPREQRVVRRVFGRGIREYLRPSFHPRERALEPLAEAWLRAHLPELADALLGTAPVAAAS